MTILSVAIAKKVEKLKTFERFCESLYMQDVLQADAGDTNIIFLQLLAYLRLF